MHNQMQSQLEPNSPSPWNAQRVPGQGFLFFLVFLSWVLFVGGPLLAHFEWIESMMGFFFFALSAMISVLVIIAGITSSVFQRWKVGLMLILLGGLPGAVVIYLYQSASDAPVINDVSTDVENVPELTSLAELPEEFSEIIEQGYPQLEPLLVDASPLHVFQAAHQLAGDQENWEVTEANPETLEVHGVAESAVFRFEDEFVIRVSVEDGQTRVDMRSRSEDRQSDMGANAARIQTFLAHLEKQVEEQPEERKEAS